MPKTPRRGRYLKKRPNPSGGNQEQAPGWNDHGNLVAGRGQGRAKNKDYPALGKTGDASLGPQGSANSLGIYLWRYLPGPRCRRCPDPSKMQYCHLDTSSTGNIRCCCSWSTCHRHRRSSRMALLKALEIPDNITLLSLPAKWAELNRSRPYGNLCAITGSQTEYSNPTTTLLTIVASPGTNSSINPGELCPSDYATGTINDSFCKLVLSPGAARCGSISNYSIYKRALLDI